MLASFVSLFVLVWMTTLAESVVVEMYADCKDDYTCLMYPENCANTGKCELVAIIEKFGSNYRFRLLGSGPYYVAAGISKDRAMGGDFKSWGKDAVVFCTEDVVGTAINPEGRNTTIISDWNPDIGNVDMKIENGRIVCAFDVPMRFTVGKLKIDLAKPQYLLLAAGPRQYPPYAGIPFAGHAVKLISYYPLLFGVGRPIKGRIGDVDRMSEKSDSGKNTLNPFISCPNHLILTVFSVLRVSSIN